MDRVAEDLRSTLALNIDRAMLGMEPLTLDEAGHLQSQVHALPCRWDEDGKPYWVGGTPFRGEGP